MLLSSPLLLVCWTNRNCLLRGEKGVRPLDVISRGGKVSFLYTYSLLSVGLECGVRKGAFTCIYTGKEENVCGVSVSCECMSVGKKAARERVY